MNYYENFSLEPIEGEIWKDIVGYEGLYKISNMGRIFSFNPSFYFPNGGLCKRESLIKKQSKDKDGYLHISLTKNKKAHSFTMHRLVAKHFIENTHNYPCIDHINGNRDDNRVENLRWCTWKQNANFTLAKINRSASAKRGYALNPNRCKKFKDYIASKCIPVFQYDVYGNLINSFKSLSDAGKYLRNVECRHRGKTVFYHKGFLWSEHEINDFSIFPYKPPTISRKVIKTSVIDGTIIEYNSIRKAYLTENTTKHFMKKICDINGIYKDYKFAYE